MITLDMTRKAAGKPVTDNAFTLESGVLILQVSLGTYSLTGKTITAAFSPKLVETATLSVVNDVIQIPISPALIQVGENEIQLNIRSTGKLEQSPIMTWIVMESVLSTTSPSPDPDITGQILADIDELQEDVADLQSGKVDKVTGYGLSQNDFTDAFETKLTNIEAGADVTDAVNVGVALNGVDAKTPPIDADTLAYTDTQASNVLKKLTWANVKAFLKTYFDSLYLTFTGSADNLTFTDTNSHYTTDEVGEALVQAGVEIDALEIKDNISNLTPANSVITASATGATITRNVADANPALLADLVNASSTGNIAEFKAGSVLLGFVDKLGTYGGGAEVTVTNKNKYYPLLKDKDGNVIAKRFTFYWSGSAYIADTSNAFGSTALNNNTGATSNAFGFAALQNNTGANSNAFGSYALYNNTGVASNAFGSSSLQNNTGATSNAFGSYALYNNTGVYSNAFGSSSLQNNTGATSNAFGSYALQNNTGANSNAFGYYTLRYNQSANNTAVGNQSNYLFLDNVAGNKTADYTEVNITLERITLTSHGFGATNAYVNIKYASTTGTAIGGLAVASIYQVKIIDANTIEFYDGAVKHNLTSQGTGTHTFTPQTSYANTTCLGANTQPNRSNQVVLGDTTVDTVKMGGATRTPSSDTDTGVKGEMCWDASYIYICVATNTWKRTALTW